MTFFCNWTKTFFLRYKSFIKRYDEIGGEFCLSISQLQEGDVGNYTCVVTNAYGSDRGHIEVQGTGKYNIIVPLDNFY